MRRRATQAQSKPESFVFSDFSSPAIRDSGWACSDFMLGAGMVIIQPSSHKVVILCEDRGGYKRWFLPRGRKDVGESLEQAALREAFEEARHEGVCMPDEQGYVSHIVTFDDAWDKLSDPTERKVITYARQVYSTHLNCLKAIEGKMQAGRAEASS
ncbi:nudix hydrolase [Moniliophthora roreri MCA 2997]|uniref:Nudix hydrolase n=1 Tax=Moniliophthora roreri (strain MCA 2997) TaxID=1381753 RepID=V2XLC8_MONRO|nr:nudix hydrolase [Moniliophthora roreri MCA 2997]